MIRLSLYFLLWIGAIAINILASQNIDRVNIKFMYWESIRLPLGLVLTFSLGLGALIATLMQTSLKKISFPQVTKSSQNQSSKSSTTNFFNNKNKQTSARTEVPEKKRNSQDSFDDEWNDDWE
ncbi:DUF1049 domain-containing protein [Pseudanabaena biceps]|nr:DUF1049 domain-containing protein [Pseudanabaena biceps]